MSGLSLAATQARLKHYVLDTGNDVTPVLPLLDDRFGLAPQERLNIYHAAYRARLREALGVVFERTWAYVGDEEFVREVTNYIEQTPSHSPNLRDYGNTFADFLAASLPRDPEVTELAQMDWLLHEAFDAPDRTRLQVDALTALSDEDWESAGFVFSPGLALTVFAWNTMEVWHAIDQQQTPPPARPLPQSVPCLFWRKDNQSRFRSLHPVEYRLLGMLIEGAGFAASCAAVADDHPEAAALIGPCLQRWLSDGMISAIVLRPDAPPEDEGGSPQ